MHATDGQLISRVRSGDREAFGELVARYRDMVYGLSYHLTGNFEEARDLAQEAFIQAYLKLGQLREPERFTGWLRQVTTNLHRSRSRIRAVPTVPLEAEVEAMAQDQPSEPTRPGIEVVVRDALAKLREPERLALTLHYINGYSQAEIGYFLGVRPETVKTRLARARQHLREEMMAMVEDTFDQKKLPEEFARETVEAAIRRADDLQNEGKTGEAYQAYRDVARRVGFGSAMKGCEAILRNTPDDMPTLTALACTKWQAGENEEALSILRRVLQQNPSDRVAALAADVLLITMNRGDEYLTFLEERQKVDPKPAAEYHTMRGNACLVQQHIEAAEHEFRLALAAEPHFTQIGARGLLAAILAVREEFMEAESLWEENLTVAPGSGDATYYRLNIGQIRYYARDYDRAIEILQEALIVDSRLENSYIADACLFYLERCYQDSGRAQLFPGVCRDLIVKMPNHDLAWRARWYLAFSLENRGLQQEALAQFEQLGAIRARCWRAILPFGDGQGANMASAYPPEESVELGTVHTGKLGAILRWQIPCTQGTGFLIDLHAQASTSPITMLTSPWGIAYAYLQVSSPRARSAIFRLGTQGSVEVWLNKQSIFAGATYGNLPDRYVVPIKLRRGRNALLVKSCIRKDDVNPPLQPGYPTWGIMARITNEAGEPLRDLKYPLGE